MKIIKRLNCDWLEASLTLVRRKLRNNLINLFLIPSGSGGGGGLVPDLGYTLLRGGSGPVLRHIHTNWEL